MKLKKSKKSINGGQLQTNKQLHLSFPKNEMEKSLTGEQLQTNQINTPTDEQLQNLSKSDLINMILQLTKPMPAPRVKKTNT